MLYLCKAEGDHPQASALLALFVLMRTIQESASGLQLRHCFQKYFAFRKRI